MPIYEYECKKCGKQIEAIQKMSDPPLKRCKECGGKLERLLSPVGIQFKGSGWYVTDYARKGSGGNGESKSSSVKSAESNSDSKTSSNSGSKSETT